MKMIPLGFSGGGEYIQSSEDTFFSVFQILKAVCLELQPWLCSAYFCDFHDNPDFGSDREDYGRNRSSQLLLDTAPYYGEDDQF